MEKEKQLLQKKEEEKQTTVLYEKHFEILSDYAIANKNVSIWRPVDPEVSKGFSVEGDEAPKAKTLNTKGKSSPFSLIRGEIPFDAGLSKLAITKPKEIGNYQKKNEEIVKKGEKAVRQMREEVKKWPVAKKDEEKKEEKKEGEKKEEEKRETEEERKKKEKIEREAIEKFNEQYHVGKKQKKVKFENKEYPLLVVCQKGLVGSEEVTPVYFPEAKEGEVVHPVFLIKLEDDKYKRYDPSKKLFNQEYQAKGSFTIKEVEVIAYIQFEKLEQGTEYVEKKRTVIADYDELCSASKKMFPFEHKYFDPKQHAIKEEKNEVKEEEKEDEEKKPEKVEKTSSKPYKKGAEEIKVPLQKTVFDEILKEKPIAGKHVGALLVYEYEAREKQKRRKLMNMGSAGFLNDMELPWTVARKIDTFGAINHGPEIHNPFPEGFKKDEEYLVLLPFEFYKEKKIAGTEVKVVELKTRSDESDEKIKVCHLVLGGKGKSGLEIEKQVCLFINKMRERGYPLGVNPKWSWKRNEKEQLEVIEKEEEKIDWKRVYEETERVEKEFKRIEDTILLLKGEGSQIKSSEENYLMRLKLEFPKMVNNKSAKLKEGNFKEYKKIIEDIKKKTEGRLDDCVDIIQSFIKLKGLMLEANICYQKEEGEERYHEIYDFVREYEIKERLNEVLSTIEHVKKVAKKFDGLPKGFPAIVSSLDDINKVASKLNKDIMYKIESKKNSFIKEGWESSSFLMELKKEEKALKKKIEEKEQARIKIKKIMDEILWKLEKETKEKKEIMSKYKDLEIKSKKQTDFIRKLRGVIARLKEKNNELADDVKRKEKEVRRALGEAKREKKRKIALLEKTKKQDSKVLQLELKLKRTEGLLQKEQREKGKIKELLQKEGKIRGEQERKSKKREDELERRICILRKKNKELQEKNEKLEQSASEEKEESHVEQLKKQREGEKQTGAQQKKESDM